MKWWFSIKQLVFSFHFNFTWCSVFHNIIWLLTYISIFVIEQAIPSYKCIIVCIKWTETRSEEKKAFRCFKKKRRRSNYDEQEDNRISDLPVDVLHQILFFLPIKSIAQTSVLPRRWRNLWYSFPDLNFTSLYILMNASNARK